VRKSFKIIQEVVTVKPMFMFFYQENVTHKDRVIRHISLV